MVRRLHANERGQATVEMVLALPILLFILFAIVQFGITYSNYLGLTDAVRAGARKAVVTHDPAAAKAAVVGSVPGLGGFTAANVTVTGPLTPGSDVTVSATYPYNIDLLGVVVKTGNLTSSTTERVE
jgi:Flp pilus assembly protein TadG